MFRNNLIMSPANGPDPFGADACSPKSAFASIAPDAEGEVEGDIGARSSAQQQQQQQTLPFPSSSQEADTLQQQSDGSSTILRPAFWRRKSEEEFLRATIVCVPKASPTVVTATSFSGCARSRDGSSNGDVALSPKPSCLKRSPSAPQRTPHSSGLHPLRSRSVAGTGCRAVRFDSKPPIAAFTHSGKDYDRTPIESTQGRGGDLDVSLPPRGGSFSPDHDDDDDDDDGHHEDRQDAGSQDGDDSVAEVEAVLRAHKLAMQAREEAKAASGGIPFGDELGAANPGSAALAIPLPTASAAATAIGHASPGLTSCSEATSVTSSVFDDSDCGSTSTSSVGGCTTSGVQNIHIGSSGISIPALSALVDASALTGTSTTSASAMALAAAAAAAAAAVASTDLATRSGPSSLCASPASIGLPPSLQQNQYGPNKWAAAVPCSTDVERAMIRRKLEFGGRWLRTSGFGCADGFGNGNGSEKDCFPSPVSPMTVVTAVSSSPASGTDTPEHATASTTLSSLTSSSAYAAQFLGTPLSSDSLALASSLGGNALEQNPSNSDISVLSSTLCSSEGTTAFLSSSPGSADGHVPLGAALEAAAASAGGETVKGGLRRPCALKSMLGRTFLPLGSHAANFVKGGGGASDDDDGNDEGRRLAMLSSSMSQRTPTREEKIDVLSWTEIVTGGEADVHGETITPVMATPTTTGWPGPLCSSPASPQKSGTASSSSSTTATKKKKKRCSSSVADEKASAFACRRDFLLENTMGGALDGF